MLRTENWCGYDIRFIEINGEWWAILKDICDALKLQTKDISQRLSPDMLERVKVETSDVVSNDIRSDHPSNGDGYEHSPVKSVNKDTIGKDIGRRPGDNKTRWILAVNELGIYEALFASRKLETRKFRGWAGRIMKRLRSQAGLEGYEVMRMADKDVQDQIDHLLDTLFCDDAKHMLMPRRFYQSITIAAGDVDPVPFEM